LDQGEFGSAGEGQDPSQVDLDALDRKASTANQLGDGLGD
jgi:hypothetical protein